MGASVGIGRRPRLKIAWPQGREGSSPSSPIIEGSKKKVLAYIVGVALGDGNLSNPNGRAVRLRITCDTQYLLLASEIQDNLKILFPKNKISTVWVPGKTTYFNISVYSNRLLGWMPWQVGKGTKLQQQAHIPTWILKNQEYSKECLRGLLQTDGSIYRDRGYIMVNFTNCVLPLIEDVYSIISKIGYQPRISKTKPSNSKNIKYVVRIAKDSKKFIEMIDLHKI